MDTIIKINEDLIAISFKPEEIKFLLKRLNDCAKNRGIWLIPMCNYCDDHKICNEIISKIELKAEITNQKDYEEMRDKSVSFLKWFFNFMEFKRKPYKVWYMKVLKRN